MRRDFIEFKSRGSAGRSAVQAPHSKQVSGAEVSSVKNPMFTGDHPIGRSGPIATMRIGHTQKACLRFATQVVALFLPAAHCELIEKLELAQESATGQIHQPAAATVYPVLNRKIHLLRDILVVCVQNQDAVLV